MSLTHQAITGIKWSTASQVLRQTARVLTLVVVAGLIGPAAYGVVVMALVVTRLIDLFGDLGTAAAIIQRKEPSQRLLSTLFWTNVAVGAGAGLILLAAAPLIGLLFQDSEVVSVLQALSPCFLIAGAGLVQRSLLEKAMRFRAIAAIEVASAITSSCVGITTAALGLGAYSLVLLQITLVSMLTSGTWLAGRWLPSRAFALDDLRSVFGYSSNVVGFDVVNYFARNADNFLVGRYLGATSLGFYAMAYNVLLFPLQMVSQSISRVTFPAYAAVQDDKPRIARGYLRVARAVSTVSFPVLTGIAILATPLVATAYGPAWGPAATVLMILAPVGAVQSLSIMNGTIYRAIGRTDVQFRLGLLWSVLIVVSFVVGLQWGITGVAASYAVTSTVIVGYPLFAIPLGLIGLRVRDLLKVLWRPLIASAGMGAVLGASRLLLPGLETTIPGLVGLVVAGAVSYLALSWAINRAELISLAELLGLSKLAGRMRGTAPSAIS